MKKIIIKLILAHVNLVLIYSQKDLSKPFIDCGVNGSTTIFDYKSKMWISSDIIDSNIPTLPASTFKIINTLIALETGVILTENDIIRWPGSTDTIKYGYRPKIYRDMSLRDAFKYSAGWAYIELAKRIGKDKYRNYLTDCDYGNVDLSIEDDDFWNFGNFAISPINQIQILIAIYEEKLPFKKEYFQILKSMMIVDQNENYIIRAKTGWTRVKGQDIGWWVGYIEKDENIYFFATRLKKERSESNPNFGNCRKEITLKILKQLNLLSNSM